jgi:hypothetical protein
MVIMVGIDTESVVLGFDQRLNKAAGIVIQSRNPLSSSKKDHDHVTTMGRILQIAR